MSPAGIRSARIVPRTGAATASNPQCGSLRISIPSAATAEETATGHGTQKPVELMRRAIVNHTEAGDAVYDPFLGSGTTLIAAEMSSRCCLGLDIDTRYVDVVVLRWQTLTGKRSSSGERWNAI